MSPQVGECLYFHKLNVFLLGSMFSIISRSISRELFLGLKAPSLLEIPMNLGVVCPNPTEFGGSLILDSADFHRDSLLFLRGGPTDGWRH